MSLRLEDNDLRTRIGLAQRRQEQLASMKQQSPSDPTTQHRPQTSSRPFFLPPTSPPARPVRKPFFWPADTPYPGDERWIKTARRSATAHAPRRPLDTERLPPYFSTPDIASSNRNTSAPRHSRVTQIIDTSGVSDATRATCRSAFDPFSNDDIYDRTQGTRRTRRGWLSEQAANFENSLEQFDANAPLPIPNAIRRRQAELTLFSAAIAEIASNTAGAGARSAGLETAVTTRRQGRVEAMEELPSYEEAAMGRTCLLRRSCNSSDIQRS